MLLIALLLSSMAHLSAAMTCFECTSSQGTDCKLASSSCRYGLFGCVKIAVLNGGVDRMGNFYDEERHISMMVRGCALLPMGGVDMCEQSSLFGYRVVKCTCFNDYCNSSPKMASILAIFFVIFYQAIRCI
ncbi:unnamed protein product, partial [Mesorhabditis spiculigera]